MGGVRGSGSNFVPFILFLIELARLSGTNEIRSLRFSKAVLKPAVDARFHKKIEHLGDTVRSAPNNSSY